MGVTLLFPGQGSQYIGMGQNLMKFEECADVFHTANNILNYDLTNICLNGPEEELKLTANTQPAIVAHSYALFRRLKDFLDERSIEVDQVLGHSVGEYAALAAAGTLSIEDAIRAVHARGTYMQEAVPAGIGAMYALIKVPANVVQEACDACSKDKSHQVMPANFNEPNQIVISGHKGACEDALAWLKKNYASKHMAIPLKVSAPFHSSLMRPAEKKLAAFFDEIEFLPNNIKYVANVNAKTYEIGTDRLTLRNNLIEQVCGSVLWSQSIKNTSSEKYIEVGPGKVLTGLNKKIDPSKNTFTLDEDPDFTRLEDFLS